MGTVRLETPVEIIPSTFGSWATVDLKAFLPAIDGATMVFIDFFGGGSPTRTWGLRGVGELGDTQTGQGQLAAGYFCIPLTANEEIELFISDDANWATINILGYTDAVVKLGSPVSILASGNTNYRNIDVSASVPGNAAFAVIRQQYANARISYDYRIPMARSTSESWSFGAGLKSFADGTWVAPLDGSKQFAWRDGSDHSAGAEVAQVIGWIAADDYVYIPDAANATPGATGTYNAVTTPANAVFAAVEARRYNHATYREVATQNTYWPGRQSNWNTYHWIPAVGGLEISVSSTNDANYVRGAFVESAAAVAPTISGVTPSTITPSSAPTLSGSSFGATPQAVLLSPTDDRTDVAAEAQTIGGGAGDTSVPTTGVVLPTGASHGDTLYYFIQAENGEWNAAGFAVTLNLAPTGSADEIFGATTDGFRLRFTTNAGNGTIAYAVFANAVDRDAWTASGDPGALTQPANSLAWGTQAVTQAGVQETALITGLGENQLRYYRIFHYGDVTA